MLTEWSARPTRTVFIWSLSKMRAKNSPEQINKGHKRVFAQRLWFPPHDHSLLNNDVIGQNKRRSTWISLLILSSIHKVTDYPRKSLEVLYAVRGPVRALRVLRPAADSLHTGRFSLCLLCPWPIRWQDAFSATRALSLFC